VSDQSPGETTQALLEHLLADVHAIAKQVSEIHAELETYRPLLRMFRPGNGTSDVQRAGMVKALRRAARGG
jgi:hypothetical protein